MTKTRSLLRRVRRSAAGIVMFRAVQRPWRRIPGWPYDPGAYWEGRSCELIETYDHPETWPGRGWLRAGAEEETVPTLLGQHDCHSVLVIGAGSGRQYGFLGDVRVSGFDISPTLVEECRKRYPAVPTVIGQVVGCERLFGSHDAVFSSAVLGHVPPRQIKEAISSVKASATRLVVIREYTALSLPPFYEWVHDYERLMDPWQIVHREVTDDQEAGRAELIAFAPPGADAAVSGYRLALHVLP
jgi:hypothetical protein